VVYSDHSHRVDVNSRMGSEQHRGSAVLEFGPLSG